LGRESATLNRKSIKNKNKVYRQVVAPGLSKRSGAVANIMGARFISPSRGPEVF
jgi:hypothetical protein